MKHGNMRKKMRSMKISITPTANPEVLKMFTMARFNSKPKLELIDVESVNRFIKRARIA